jgi:two-component system, NarL family, invasion response regulator UvrY
MLRILLADDHAIVRVGITQLLREAYPDAIIEEVGTAEDLVKKVIKHDWDIIISDVDMPGRNGLEVLHQIKEIKPKVPVLFLSIFPESLYALRALKAGASGYLNKDAAPDELINAIQRVLQGRTYLSPPMSEKLVTAFQNDSNKLPHETLSDREMQVFIFLAQGKSLTNIAEILSLNITTISTYRSKILIKLKAENNAELVKYAIKHNIVPGLL